MTGRNQPSEDGLVLEMMELRTKLALAESRATAAETKAAMAEAKLHVLESELRQLRWVHPVADLLRYQTLAWDCRPNEHGGEDVHHTYRTIEGDVFDAHWQTAGPPGPGCVGIAVTMPRLGL